MTGTDVKSNLLHDNLTVNPEGHLCFAGVDTVTLAQKYGTALYLLDEDRIRKNARLYLRGMKKYFGGDSGPLFASKAASFRQIYRIIAETGSEGGRSLSAASGSVSCLGVSRPSRSSTDTWK